MARVEASELHFFEPITGSISKEGVRANASESLVASSLKISRSVASFLESDTFANMLQGKSEEDQVKLNNTLLNILAVGQHSQEWSRDNYVHSNTFDTQIETKALEYASSGADNDTNYFDSLGNKHDQAEGARIFYEDFAEKVASLTKTTDKEKEKDKKSPEEDIIEQIIGLSEVDEDKEIYLLAEEVWKVRTGPRTTFTTPVVRRTEAAKGEDDQILLTMDPEYAHLEAGDWPRSYRSSVEAEYLDPRGDQVDLQEVVKPNWRRPKSKLPPFARKLIKRIASGALKKINP